MRIANTEIPENKHVFISLTYIKGIGLTTSKKILDKLQINHNRLVSSLTNVELNQLSLEIDKYVIESNLTKRVNYDIQRLVEINCYRGVRHKLGLPVRGQKTHSNAKTRKKNRKKIN